MAGAVENQIVPKQGNRLSFLSRTHDSKTMTKDVIAAKSHEGELAHVADLHGVCGQYTTARGKTQGGMRTFVKS